MSRKSLPSDLIRGWKPVLRKGHAPTKSKNRVTVALLDDAELAAGRRILISRHAVAILRDGRLAALFPLAIAFGRMGPLGLVGGLRHGPDIRVAGLAPAHDAVKRASTADAAADCQAVGMGRAPNRRQGDDRQHRDSPGTHGMARGQSHSGTAQG